MGLNFCPVCGEELAAESINVAEGVAPCGGCGQLSRLSEVASRRRPMVEILREPPAGCSMVEWGGKVVIRATLRSVGGFLGLLAVTLFWNGIVSIFVLLALEGLYTNLVGPLPEAFPAPERGNAMPLGMALFLCLFLIPFVVIGSGMVGALLLNIVGKIEVIIGDSEGVVRTGVGPFVWRRRFDPKQVRRVSTAPATWQSDGQKIEVIVIEADKKVKFGSLLREERREWMEAVLQAVLVRGRDGQRGDGRSAVARVAPRN